VTGSTAGAVGTKLGSNVAVGNVGWGIAAVAGVDDLGGNKAAGNLAGQCQVVVCGTP